MTKWLVAVAALFAMGKAAAAQQWIGEVHGTYARTTQSHLQSWGAAVRIAAAWGKTAAPVQIGTALTGDWQRQENSGPDQWSLGYDLTAQPGGQHMLTPYVGGSVSANWLHANGSTSRAELGLQYIVGIAVKPEAESQLLLKLELRPGYVRTQEHSLTVRFGVAWSM